MLNTLSFPEIKFPEGFVWGSATAAHQIEGDDINSENWYAEERMRPASPMVRRKRDFFEWEFTKKMNAVGL